MIQQVQNRVAFTARIREICSEDITSNLLLFGSKELDSDVNSQSCIQITMNKEMLTVLDLIRTNPDRIIYNM